MQEICTSTHFGYWNLSGTLSSLLHFYVFMPHPSWLIKEIPHLLITKNPFWRWLTGENSASVKLPLKIALSFQCVVFRFTNNPLFYLIFKDLDRFFGLTEECWETLRRVLCVPQTLKGFSHFCTCVWGCLKAAITPRTGHRPAAALAFEISTFNFSKLENIVPMRS